MKINRNDDQLRIMMGEAGGGGLTCRVDWEDYDADGKFIGVGSQITAGIDHTTQHIVVTATAPDDGSVRKITGIWLPNTDASNARTYILYLERVGSGFMVVYKGSLPIGANFHYSLENGFRIYNVAGLLMNPTPV